MITPDTIRASYRHCNSLACRLEFNRLYRGATPRTQRKTGAILFERGKVLEVSWVDHSRPEENEHRIVWRDDKATRYLPVEDRWQDESSVEMALAAEAGISGGISYFVPSLLLQLDDFLKFTTVQNEPDIVFKGQICHCLDAFTESGGRSRLILAKEPVCILHLEEHFAISSCEVEQVTTYTDIQWVNV